MFDGQPKRSRTKVAHQICGAILAMSILVPSSQALASPMPGDRLNFEATETSGPAPGLTVAAVVTLGAPLAAPFFNITGFKASGSGGFCGVCVASTTDVSAAEFDSSTMGLVGTITGAYPVDHGTFTYVLTLTDIVSLTGTWDFKGTDPRDGSLTESAGTYVALTPAPAVPEPVTLFFFCTGLAGVVAVRRRQNGDV